MRKILATIVLALTASTAMADGFHHRGYHPGYYRPSYNWVAPTIIGGVIGYEIARNQQPVYVQQPVYIQQQPVYVQQPICTVWTEVQQPDGTITRTRTCSQ
jgi:hypothetical protein